MNAKKKDKNDNSLVKVRFSIGAKLITIITIIVIVSLGSITALVSWLVSQDLRVAAESNNFEINRRSALEAEHTFERVRSNTLMLMQAVTDLGADSALARDMIEFFFTNNQQVASLVCDPPGGDDVRITNERFFLSRGIDPGMADSYWDLQAQALTRAVLGETQLLNAAPHFNISLLAMFIPVTNGGVAVLFSPDNLNDAFSFGVNQSSLINASGDVLIHSDFALVRSGVNVADDGYILYVMNNLSRNAQTLYTDNDGVRFFGAFYKLNTGGCTVITSIEYDKVFEGIAATTRRNIYLTGAVLFISVMFIWFFAKNITVPLKALAAAARTVEEGAFDVELRHKGRDEVGVLTSSFRRMCAALGIFGRFTHRDIALRAMRGEIKPGGLPKHATIFFSDIRGFTAKSEHFTKTFKDEAPDRIVNWLNEYLTKMVECVEKTGGTVDKFIGDAVMAHWGTADTSGTPQGDAFNCIKAALMMRSALFQMNKDRRADDPSNPPIQIGCGINTGVVTAGQIGSDVRMEYTVIGDPVNLASRIEALNKPLGTDILVTEDTWRMVKNHFIFEEMPPVSIKGKEKPVRIFAVINAAGVEKSPRSLSEVRKLLGIKAPDMSRVDINTDEIKYKIGSAE